MMRREEGKRMTDLATRLGDCRLDLGGGSVHIVREAFDDKAGASGAVSLIAELLIISLRGTQGRRESENHLKS